MYRSYMIKPILGLKNCLSLLTVTTLLLSPLCKANSSIGYIVKVLNPTSSPEVYSVPTGLVQWHEGLPIPVQDTIQITASIAAGTESIKTMTSSLDGKPLAPVVAAPWSVTVAGGTLALGDHLLEISTSLADKHNAVAKFPVAFTVVTALPSDLVPPTAVSEATTPVPVASSVAGSQQIFSKGSVTSQEPTAGIFFPPAVDQTRQQVADPGIMVSFADPIAASQRKAGVPVGVNGDLTVALSPGQGSAANRFVFAIYRDGEPIYTSVQTNPLAGAHIKLQSQTPTMTQGLLPGVVQLYVWGVTPSGDYTAPTIVSFSINDSDVSNQTK